MNRLIGGQPLLVHGTGEQTRDFIYVEDVAYAIYRSVNSPHTGIYNLSSNTQASVNQIIEVLQSIEGSAQVEFTGQREGDIEHSCLDNRKVARDLDWSPLYSIEEGLRKTASYLSNETARNRLRSQLKVCRVGSFQHL